VAKPGHDRGQVERPVERLERARLDVPQYGFPFGRVEKADSSLFGTTGSSTPSHGFTAAQRRCGARA
jgi:hypothetical protein